ncbi:hypothetical protein [Amycolatopsis sp. NPDC059657]|uniref:hypothetical protein n=1 Tax=Amycolatopsis sp. NPDC059657 TaxID=3346899 RepID=UPI003672C49A
MPLRVTYPEACTLCGPCWATIGGDADASEIGPTPEFALPVRAPHSQVEYSTLFAAEPWVQKLRRDAREKLLALVTALRDWADWSTFETWPTWARLCEASGWARSTMAGWLRQLWVTGWIARIEPGSTPEHRPMGSPEAAEGNRAAVYGLRIPASVDRALRAAERAKMAADADAIAEELAQLSASGEETWTPSLSFDLEELKIELNHLRTRTSELVDNFGSCPEVEKIEALRARFDRKNPGYRFSDTAPRGRAEMLVAASELQRQHSVLGRLSPRAIRSLARPYWRAGWTNRCLLWALRYQPTGWVPLKSLAEYAVIHSQGWVRTRLAAWTDERGRPLPGRGALKARHHDQPREEFRRDQEKYGVQGAKLARENSCISPDIVATHGRRCAEQLAAEQRADQVREAVVAQAREAEAARKAAQHEAEAAERAALQAALIEQAREYAAREQPDVQLSATLLAHLQRTAPAEPVDPAERLARARARAHAEGHGDVRFGLKLKPRRSRNFPWSE